MDQDNFKKLMTSLILIALIVLAFFLLKPIAMAIIAGIILGFIFNPIYGYLNKYLRNGNVTAFLMCVLIVIVIVIPIWFLLPVIIEQSFKFYETTQNLDIVAPLKPIFPSLFESEQFSYEFSQLINNFIGKTTNAFMNSLSNIVLNFPKLFLQTFVVFFVMFFILRDSKSFVEYIKSLLPFSKDVERKLFAQTKGITASVIYGQVIIGLIQGIIVGIGYFIFGVPNALLLSFLSAIAGIFPIIGPTVVYIPVLIFLLIAGNPFAALGVTIFGLVSSSIDNLIRPLIVSRMTKIHSAILLIGMIGGLFLFGFLGFILGPLILSYILVILEIYRDKKGPGLFQQTCIVR